MPQDNILILSEGNIEIKGCICIFLDTVMRTILRGISCYSRVKGIVYWQDIEIPSSILSQKYTLINNTNIKYLKMALIKYIEHCRV